MEYYYDLPDVKSMMLIDRVRPARSDGDQCMTKAGLGTSGRATSSEGVALSEVLYLMFCLLSRCYTCYQEPYTSGKQISGMHKGSDRIVASWSGVFMARQMSMLWGQCSTPRALLGAL